MSDEYQSSNEITGDLTKDRDVLARGRVELQARNQGPSSIYAPYYYVSYSKDIEFLNVSALRPEVEVYESYASGPPLFPYEIHRKCPYTQWRTGARDIERVVNVSIYQATSKATGISLRLIIEMFSSTQDVQRTFFYTVRARMVASNDGSLYPSDGSFT